VGAFGKAALAVATIVVVVVLFLALRPEDTSNEQAATPPATATAETRDTGIETGETVTDSESETETETEGETGQTNSGPERQVIRLNVQAGESRIERVDIREGERVVLVVNANVSDHVHLHGYDLMADVAPGQTARIEFRATIPGVFEVELEDRVQQIAQLTVAP
jgi:hypothetical protein